MLLKLRFILLLGLDFTVIRSFDLILKFGRLCSASQSLNVLCLVSHLVLLPQWLLHQDLRHVFYVYELFKPTQIYLVLIKDLDFQDLQHHLNHRYLVRITQQCFSGFHKTPIAIFLSFKYCLKRFLNHFKVEDQSVNLIC